MTVEKATTDQSIELKRFLNIFGIAEFIYDAAADELSVFKYGPEKEILYTGNLDGWGLNIKLSGSDASKKQLNSFYDALKQAKPEYVSCIDLVNGRYTVGFRTYAEEGNKCYGMLIPPGQDVSGSAVPEYRRASDRDAMLDMLNKRAINEYAQKVCAKEDCPTTYFIIFDLDNFKVVNDSFGHMFGDGVLHTVTAIINNVIGEHGMVGRIGGDEIMIVTKDIHSKTDLRPFMRDIRIGVEEQFKDKLNGISLTCSMVNQASLTDGTRMRTSTPATAAVFRAKSTGSVGRK